MRPRRRLKSTSMTLLRAGCNLARKLAASYRNVNARRPRNSVAAVARVGLERELLEQPLLGLTHRDRSQHLLRLLCQRHRRHDAGELGHRELADRVLHLVQHGARDLAHLHGSRQLECLVEALGEALTRLRALLGRGGNVQLGGGGVVELVEGGEDGVAGRHAPHVHTIRLEANPACAALWHLATHRAWQTEPAAWAIPSDGRCPSATRRASTAAHSSGASSASRACATASPSMAATSGRS